MLERSHPPHPFHSLCQLPHSCTPLPPPQPQMHSSPTLLPMFLPPSLPAPHFGGRRSHSRVLLKQRRGLAAPNTSIPHLMVSIRAWLSIRPSSCTCFRASAGGGAVILSSAGAVCSGDTCRCPLHQQLVITGGGWQCSE